LRHRVERQGVAYSITCLARAQSEIMDSVRPSLMSHVELCVDFTVSEAERRSNLVGGGGWAAQSA